MRKRLLGNLFGASATEKAPSPGEVELEEVGRALEREAGRRLGRSLSIREVDAGSCNACELEINALSNPYYDIERFGIRFVASPRHADVLLVTGPVLAQISETLGKPRDSRATAVPWWV
jgi:NADH:ubiquinone oxidoreductase subunit B-like Fe-S oxidoreductase